MRVARPECFKGSGVNISARFTLNSTEKRTIGRAGNIVIAQPFVYERVELFRNKKLLELMRECPCGNCGIDDGTVIAAHRNEGKGMGIKVSDALVAPLCWGCHYILDQGKQLSREERRDYWNRAYINGMQYLIENKMLVIK